ncbi:MAG TPA: hypothetical protein VML55_22600, partial [Planctomycetaceae bacterium]|nr:hypothetical protein [Planctomycetaceae bacterium]
MQRIAGNSTGRPRAILGHSRSSLLCPAFHPDFGPPRSPGGAPRSSSRMNVSAVIPVYNEVENLGRLYAELRD